MAIVAWVRGRQQELIEASWLITVAAGQTLSTVIELMNIMTCDLMDIIVSAKRTAASWGSVSSQSSLI